MGVDFQLIRNLNLTVELGYGFRVMKIRYKKWGANQQEPASDLSDKYSLKDVNFLHCIDFELGISYAFSFKKKEKPNPIE